VLVSVLTGGAMFLADLVRSIDARLETHFMAISRYGGAEESRGRVQILLDVDADLTDRDVILVEDMVDTGMTSRYLLSVLGARHPATLEICALLDRSVRRIVPLEPRYVGFDCPDAFVVGYGLDFMDRYRSIPDILRVDDLAALRSDPDALAPLLTDAAA
jgi:hypoxanthine phosphoribosyltransferase